jgi:hypothetical protein
MLIILHILYSDLVCLPELPRTLNQKHALANILQTKLGLKYFVKNVK